MTTPVNPFAPATAVAKKIKLLLYGPSGSGKTIAALSFPRVAVIDTESGTDLYGGRDDIAPFSRLRAKTIDELMNAIAFIRRDGGQTFDTLVIDSMTPVYNIQKDGAFRSAKNGDLSFRDWNKIGIRMKALHDALTGLPVHLVVTAREATEYETANGELRKTGVKPDAHKDLVYIMDFVVRLNTAHEALIEKSRGLLMARQPKLDWTLFAPVAQQLTSGEAVLETTESEAAEHEAQVYAWSEETVKEWIAKWEKQGLTVIDLRAALNVTRWGEWPTGEPAADAAVEQYIARQLSTNGASS